MPYHHRYTPLDFSLSWVLVTSIILYAAKQNPAQQLRALAALAKDQSLTPGAQGIQIISR